LLTYGFDHLRHLAIYGLRHLAIYGICSPTAFGHLRRLLTYGIWPSTAFGHLRQTFEHRFSQLPVIFIVLKTLFHNGFSRPYPRSLVLRRGAQGEQAGRWDDKVVKPAAGTKGAQPPFALRPTHCGSAAGKPSSSESRSP
jgi:hypothetical protein